MSLHVQCSKERAYAAIDDAREDLAELSSKIWSNPEISFQEHIAHDTLCSFLEARGFSVERQFKLNTAFRTCIEGGENGPNIAVMCEYDALPGIGHACGHNLIAEAGIAAAVGIQAVFNSAEVPRGKLTVLGTPAEEGGGGKIHLLNAGVFDDVDVAMMVHPSYSNMSEMNLIASTGLNVRYKGKAVHAAAAPWEGLNALDAAVLAYQNISCLRQQIKPTSRICGVITDGGLKSNIIPESSSLEFDIRCPSLREMLDLKKKVQKCFDAAATATGCQVSYEGHEECYANMITNQALKRTFLENGKSLGATYTESDAVASTDMGNVSHKVPAIHPCFGIGTSHCPHTKDFTAAAGDAKAQPLTLLQGKILAATAIDVFTNQDLLEDIKECFNGDKSKQ